MPENEPADNAESTEVREPENSTVENWTGQVIERDTRAAEKAVRESGSMEEAEEQFEREAHGEEDRQRAYPRPGEEPPGGAQGNP
jgi:hypothetical protein